MPIFFIIIFAVYVLGNIYIFFRGWPVIASLHKGAKVVITCAYWLMAFAVFGVFLLRNVSVPYSIMHGLHLVGTGWLVFTMYMVMILLVVDILHLFREKIKYSFIYATIVIICVLIYGNYRYQHPETNFINIVINKPLKGYQHSVKVVAVSDIHLGYGTSKDQLKEYVQLINNQKPDLILIGGDLIDNSIHPVREQKMEEELAKLHAPLGIYMIPGNHEYISGIEDSRNFIATTPVVLLQDSVVTLPNGLQLVGRDDSHNRKRLSLDSLVAETNPEFPVILLDHQPFNLDKAAESGVDLQFSGHTHSGQVWPMTLVVDRMFELSHGYKKRGNTHLYVSSGLSLWGPPFRIGTQSEMVVFNISFTR